MMWKKMYDERICVAILLFYLHNSQLNVAIYSTSTSFMVTKKMMHHLLLEVIDSLCSNVFDMVCLISVPGHSGQ